MSTLFFSRKIALRYLWSKRSEAFITIITYISIAGVAIGVAVLSIVMAVMTGFEYELQEKIVGNDSHVLVHALGGKIEDWKDVSRKILEIPEVKNVSPFTYNQVLLKTQTRSTGLLIRGIEKGTAGTDQVAKYVRKSGTLDRLYDPPEITVTNETGAEEQVKLPGILVGKQLAQQFLLNEGNTVSVLSSQMGSTPFGLMPKFRRFVVVGTYNSGLVEYESGVAYVDLSEAQRFFGMGEAVSGLEVRVNDIDAAPQIAQQILDKLGGIAAGFTATDWTRSNKPLWDAIKLEKKVYFIVLLLIIVMASFSIITTLIMVVLEKRKDIAIMKTMGASTSSIARIFRYQGSVIGALGTICGLALGWAGCLLLQKYGFPLDERVFQMSALPVRIEGLNFAIIGAAAFFICFVATIYPARRASALEPSHTLRYE